MTRLAAEIIAVGDEMIGGARLDTNSQWLAAQLTELGIPVAFHTTVGDHLQDQQSAFRLALQRARWVIATGGLGPTADDLTRHVLADVTQLPLVEDAATLRHIQAIFRKYGREMPESNAIQAHFPSGSAIIPNSQGTAPGIDLTVHREDVPCRVFCLPGVPAEMKEMWRDYVASAIRADFGDQQFLVSRVIRCFGAGESQVEGMLENLISRDRNPLVGITASKATISLRILSRGPTRAAAEQAALETEQYIRERLGDLVFGVDGETLSTVIRRQLAARQQKLAVVDLGFHGDVLSSLLQSNARESNESPSAHVVAGGIVLHPAEWMRLNADDDMPDWVAIAESNESPANVPFLSLAERFRRDWEVDWTVAIGPVVMTSGNRERFSVAITSVSGTRIATFDHVGHSSLRHVRSVKQVLNALRLELRNS